MEALLKQPETTITNSEHLLIHEDVEQTTRINSEARTRANMLNKILGFGLVDNEGIEKLSSPSAIEDFIFREHLKVNRELMRQHKAGKKNVQNDYLLPENLERLKYSLLAFANLKMPSRSGNKYENLIFTDSWNVDHNAVERMFIQIRCKLYVEGEQLAEYREIEAVCKFFMKIKVPNNQVRDASYLNERIESIGYCLYRPRWTYFNRERS